MKILWVFLILHCFGFFLFFIVFPLVLACTADGTKLLLKYKLSAKQSWPETLVLGGHLCMRIWICARIGLSKKPLLICQAGWREILKHIHSNLINPFRAQNRVVGSALQTLLTRVRFCQWRGLSGVCTLQSSINNYLAKKFMRQSNMLSRTQET